MKIKKMFLFVLLLIGSLALVGCQGEPGIKGEKGDTGDQGQPGLKGEDGKNGADGQKGPDGAQGPQGIQGEKGDTGDKGEAGKELEFRLNDKGVLQQRYVGENDWQWVNVVDIELIAKFHQKYNVNLNVNGGTYVEAPEKEEFKDVTYLTKIALPEVTKEGFKFIGWNDGKQYYTGEYEVKESCTLTAKFGVDVVFKDAEGVELGKGVYADDDRLPVFFKFGYNFVGWYDGETKVEHVSAATTLTAKYEAVTANALYAAKNGDKINETVYVLDINVDASMMYAVNEKGLYTINLFGKTDLVTSDITAGKWVELTGEAKYHTKGGAPKYADTVVPATIKLAADQTKAAPAVKGYVIDMADFDAFITEMAKENDKVLGHYITIKNAVFTSNDAKSDNGSGYSYLEVSGKGMKVGAYYTDATKDVILNSKTYEITGYMVGANGHIGTAGKILRISANVTVK